MSGLTLRLAVPVVLSEAHPALPWDRFLEDPRIILSFALVVFLISLPLLLRGSARSVLVGIYLPTGLLVVNQLGLLKRFGLQPADLWINALVLLWFFAFKVYNDRRETRARERERCARTGNS